MALKYLGGAYIHGVPARDLTDEEEEKYSAIIAEQQAATGAKLYENVKPATKRAKQAEEGES